MLHDALRMLELWCPATFAHAAAADCSFTWRSAADLTRKRIDYVAIPLHWRSRRCLDAVAYDFDTLMSVYDHMPTVVTLQWVDDLWCGV